MPKKDPKIDAIAAKAPPFAKPILKHFRSLIHRNCPQVEESVKWGMPFFSYNDRPLAGFGIFKAHCRLVFWKGSRFVKPDGTKANAGHDGLGLITSIKDLPSSKLLSFYIKQGMKINESNPAPRRTPQKAKAPPRAPADLLRAIHANKKAYAHYKAFSPSKQREYIDWITDAKTEETRERRLETAVEWIAQGKSRNWKYQ